MNARNRRPASRRCALAMAVVLGVAACGGKTPSSDVPVADQPVADAGSDPVAADGDPQPGADGGDGGGASTGGLGQPCPEAGCGSGQSCLTAPAPGGKTRTCEIICQTDEACPPGYRCNVPPIEPDSLQYTCVAE